MKNILWYADYQSKQKWKLPILWYIADAENQTLRYRKLERKVVGITATMLTKCLRELEQDKFIIRKQRRRKIKEEQRQRGIINHVL